MNTITRKDFDQAVSEFLKEYRESYSGDWADITDDDITQLRRLIKMLIQLKSSHDADGDYAIEFEMIDRRKRYFIWPTSLPYHDSLKTEKDVLVAVSFAGAGLSTFAKYIDTAVTLRRWNLEDENE